MRLHTTGNYEIVTVVAVVAVLRWLSRVLVPGHPRIVRMILVGIVGAVIWRIFRLCI